MENEKHEGFVIIRAPAQVETKQGLPYFLGLSRKTAGTKGICMHVAVIPPGKAGEPHCHAGHETVIYQMKGKVLCKFGEGLAQSAVVEEGNLLYIGPNVWHQPINMSETEPAVAVVARDDAEEQEHVIPYEGHQRDEVA